MSKIPKRYQFSNALPMADRPSIPANLPDYQPQQVIHVHEAPRSRAGQWIAAGLAGGALLVAASIAAIAIAVAAVAVAVCACVVLLLVREIRGKR